MATTPVEEVLRAHLFVGERAGPVEDPGWRSLPELPTAGELLAPAMPWSAIPTNDVSRPWGSRGAYLSAQYKLLRLEAVEPLRASVEAMLKRQGVPEDKTCVYTQVYVKGFAVTTNGIVTQISFISPRSIHPLGRRLNPGTVVVLDYASSFGKNLAVAVVADRPATDNTIQISWADPNKAIIDGNTELVMVEPLSGYFEAQRHTLTGLQHVAAENVPTFDRYLVNGAKTPLVPGFLDLAPDMDVSVLQDLQNCLENPGQKPRPFMVDVTKDFAANRQWSLDASQMRAVTQMLSKELAIIQGPPGTGKTYTSVAALMVMVRNRAAKDPPIVVSAQTNHALDQLLAKCMGFAKVLRLGGRTQNDDIRELSIYSLSRKFGGGGSGNLRTARRQLKAAIAHLKELVGHVLPKGLLSPVVLANAGIITQSQRDSLSPGETVRCYPPGFAEKGDLAFWLGEEFYTVQSQSYSPGVAQQIAPAEDFAEFEPETDKHLEQVTEDDDCDGLISLTNYTVVCKHVNVEWRARAKKLLAAEDDLFKIPNGVRADVYRYIEEQLRETYFTKIRGQLSTINDLERHVRYFRWRADVTTICKAKVDIIGCTTTGLTKYRGLIAATMPRTLLIEEAAETREANILSGLFSSLEQLILVGDHQQLRPSTDLHQLRFAPYNMDVSMFERLVNLQVDMSVLTQQRRMVQHLRRLLSTYYPALTDHPSVYRQPRVAGLGNNNFFFFRHSWREAPEGMSKVNRDEARMITALVSYLVKNDNKIQNITILTYYAAQKTLLEQNLRGDRVVKKALKLPDAKIQVHTVDSYQGEENEIVILSLVRNPRHSEDKSIGFVANPNRAMVALSRARRGLYIFGNPDCLLNASEYSRRLWQPIVDFSNMANQLRNKFPVECVKHRRRIEVANAGELHSLTGGGCRLKCEVIRNCGHRCALTCHPKPHSEIECLFKCTKKLDCGHGCNQLCHEECHCARSCDAFKAAVAERIAKAEAEDARRELGDAQNQPQQQSDRAQPMRINTAHVKSSTPTQTVQQQPRQTPGQVHVHAQSPNTARGQVHAQSPNTLGGQIHNQSPNTTQRQVQAQRLVQSETDSPQHATPTHQALPARPARGAAQQQPQQRVNRHPAAAGPDVIRGTAPAVRGGGPAHVRGGRGGARGGRNYATTQRIRNNNDTPPRAKKARPGILDEWVDDIDWNEFEEQEQEEHEQPVRGEHDENGVGVKMGMLIDFD